MTLTRTLALLAAAAVALAPSATLADHRWIQFVGALEGDGAMPPLTAGESHVHVRKFDRYAQR